MQLATIDKGVERNSVLIVDDHPMFRDGVRRFLESSHRYFVAGEASNGEDAVRLTQELRPDVVLLDFDLPDFSGFEVLGRFAELHIETVVILLAASIDRRQIIQALQLGARGVVTKDAGSDILAKSIHTALAGEFWVGRDVLAEWVNELRRARRPAASITARERVVMDKVLAGFSNREIAAQLGISDETVKRHISNIYDKLGVYNRMELALYVSSGRLTRIA